MNIKRAILALSSLLYVLTTAAQSPVQWGSVKTRGRMVNGTLIPGKGLPNATVEFNGNINNVTVNENGDNFYFKVPTKQYSVKNVRKQGYQLVDADVIGKNQTLSSNLLYLIMETPEQQDKDKVESERIIRRKLQKQLQDREDEIERLVEENKITEQERDQALKKLYQEQKENEKLIADMADRYSKIDYDQMDEFYRRVSYFIEQGELTKADSLLKSRGNLTQQVQVHLAEKEKYNKDMEYMQQRGSVISYDEKELDCRSYSKYEVFRNQHLRDSAAYYIDLRASIDTTNMQWQNDAGQYARLYLAQYDKALKYYQRILHLAQQPETEDKAWAATAYSNIGSVYSDDEEYDVAIDYFNKALDIWKEQDNEDSLNLATTYSLLGDACCSLGQYDRALWYHQRALAIRTQGSGQESREVAMCYNNIGGVYQSKEDMEQALHYHEMALSIRERVLGPDHPHVAQSYNNIGGIYGDIGQCDSALHYLNRAREIYEKVYGAEHIDVAMCYHNIGGIYEMQGEYNIALNNYVKALTILEEMVASDDPCLEKIRIDIASANYKKALIDEALDYFLTEHAFVVNINPGDTPAAKQGMSGEYILLEFGNWTQDSPTSLFDEMDKLDGKPKTIILLKDGEIKSHHFEGKVGAQFGARFVGNEKKAEINRLYNEWRR